MTKHKKTKCKYCGSVINGGTVCHTCDKKLVLVKQIIKMGEKLKQRCGL